jgi:hypothetical protein
LVDSQSARPTQRRPRTYRQPITQDDVQEIKQANATIKALPVTPKASDNDKAKAAASTLKKIGERLGTYLDACLLEASKELGKKVGVAVLVGSLAYAACP